MIKALTLTIALMLMPMVALGQQAQCGPRGTTVDYLGNTYGESLQVQALMGRNNQLLEIYANVDTGTWTALVIDTNAMACHVASGSNWTAVNEPPKGKGVDG